jgi:chromosome segregation ATPase
MIILFILIILILLSLVLIECSAWQGRVGGMINKVSLKKGGACNGENCGCLTFIRSERSDDSLCKECRHSKEMHTIARLKGEKSSGELTIENLIKKNEEQLAQIQKLNANLDEFRQLNEKDHKSKNDEQSDRIKKINTDNFTLTTENNNLRDQLNRLTAENNNLKKHLDYHLNVEKTTLKNQLDALNVEKTTLKNQLDDLNVENTTLKNQLDRIANSANGNSANGNENTILAEQALEYNTLQKLIHKLIRHVSTNIKEIDNLI